MDTDSQETFSVWRIFHDDTNEEAARNLSARTAVFKAKEIVDSPTCKVGVVKSVRIVDAMDNCVFEWIHGKGVVFPPQ